MATTHFKQGEAGGSTTSTASSRPYPATQVQRVEVVVPPTSVRVGITSACYAYHDVDNLANRCKEMEDLVQRHYGAKVTKRFYPCKVCFPGGAYLDPNPETHFIHTRGAASRR